MEFSRYFQTIRGNLVEADIRALLPSDLIYKNRSQPAVSAACARGVIVRERFGCGLVRSRRNTSTKISSTPLQRRRKYVDKITSLCREVSALLDSVNGGMRGRIYRKCDTSFYIPNLILIISSDIYHPHTESYIYLSMFTRLSASSRVARSCAQSSVYTLLLKRLARLFCTTSSRVSICRGSSIASTFIAGRNVTP